jgi:hypothetical protein
MSVLLASIQPCRQRQDIMPAMSLPPTNQIVFAHLAGGKASKPNRKSGVLVLTKGTVSSFVATPALFSSDDNSN